MPKSERLAFGFFFNVSDRKAMTLYFAALQLGQCKSNAHQIVITEISEKTLLKCRVAYAIDPAEIKSLDDETFEKICRIAVRQFVGKHAINNFLAGVLPLELSNHPWDGEVQLVC